jgi:5-methylcytosine-specific restriction endonuclease McrA
MATSRTGTSAWKRVRAQAIRRAQSMGITHCRHCNTLLNYEVSQTPASAEVDHIVPYANGGRDHIENVEVICRRCNGSKGSRAAPTQHHAPEPLRTSRRW